MNLIKKIKTKPLLKTGIQYSFVSSFKSLTSMGINILIMLWLTPKELGMWSAVSIFQAYVPFFQLGIQSALNRDLPILLGQNEQQLATKLVASAKGFAYIIMLFIAIIGITASLIFFMIGKNMEYVLGIFTISIIAVANSLRIHLIATFRSANAFNKLTRLYIIDIILSISSIFFIYRYHYYGLLIYYGLLSVIPAILMYCYAPYKKIKAELNKKTIIDLIKNGMILMSFSQIHQAAPTFPKWIILSLGGVTKLGLFSPANAIGDIMTMLPAQIAQFFHPQMGYKYGKTGNAKDIWPYLKKMFILMPIISLPISIGIWLIAPWVLENLFPKYIDSLWAMKIMSIGFIFSSVYTTQGILHTIRAYKYAYIFSFIELIGFFLCPMFFVKFTSCEMLTSVSLGISTISFILFFSNIFLIRKALFLPKYNHKKINLIK